MKVRIVCRHRQCRTNPTREITALGGQWHVILIALMWHIEHGVHPHEIFVNEVRVNP